MGAEDATSRPNGQTEKPPIFCEEAKRLLDQFGDAVQALMILHEQQFMAIVEGDPAASRFDLLIHDANERKQNAKYEYMNHLDEVDETKIPNVHDIEKCLESADHSLKVALGYARPGVAP